MLKNILRSLLTLTLITIFSLLSTNSSFAQDSDDLTLFSTPPLNGEKLMLEPGEVYEDSFKVANLGISTLTYYIYVSGFDQIEDYPGTSTPLSLEDDALAPYSASEWVTLPFDVVTLEPQVNVTIPFTITVPNDVALGEYNVKIFLSTDEGFTSDTESFTVTNLGSGPAILIRIGEESELIESADLIRFTTDKFLYETPPVKFLTEIENTGNTHITPSGEIVISNIFGEEIARLPFNPSNLSTIRSKASEYEVSWDTSRKFFNADGSVMIGPLKANLLIQYRTIDPGFYPLTSETTFWIIPWKLILAIIVAITLIVIGFKVKRGKK